jgi:hypothetical protein
MCTTAIRRLVATLGTFLALASTPTGGDAREASAIVAMVIDSSGSLAPADLDRTKTLAAGTLESLPSGSEVAVFSFDDQSRLLLPRSASTEEVRKAIDGIAIAGRFTALNDALYDASRYLRDAPPARKAIILVTDGKDENSALNIDDALAVAQQTSIPVFAVGLGNVQERVLRRIAKLTGGEYISAAEATGSLLAGRIAALAEPGSASAPSSADATAPGAAPLAGSSKSTQRAPSPARGPSSAWLWAGLVATLAVGGLLVLLARSRRSAPRCATCNRELAGPFSPCAFCTTAPEPPTLLERRTRPMSDEVSATVMARMDLTEEYLEKTVTLREQPVLTITNGPGAGMAFSLNRQSPTSVGRAKANDIVLEDVSVSSQHCRIRPEDGSFVLHDLKSTNGTFVNERRVTRQALAEGDTVKLGETYMQFRLNQRRA